MQTEPAHLLHLHIDFQWHNRLILLVVLFFCLPDPLELSGTSVRVAATGEVCGEGPVFWFSTISLSPSSGSWSITSSAFSWTASSCDSSFCHSKSVWIDSSGAVSQSHCLSSSKITSLLTVILLPIGSNRLYPFDSALNPNRTHLRLLSSSFVLCTLGMWAWAMQPKTLRCATDGLIPLHASYGVTSFTELVGHRFRI